jgi:hypothetical protein
LAWILREKWFWIIVIAIAMVYLLPFVIVGLILSLPPILRLILTILIIAAWGIVAGYKEWVITKRKEEEQKLGKSSQS